MVSRALSLYVNTLRSINVYIELLEKTCGLW